MKSASLLLSILMGLWAPALLAQENGSPTPQGPGNEYAGVQLPAASQDSDATEVRVVVREGVPVKPFTRDLFGFNYDWRGTESILAPPGGEAPDPAAAVLLNGIGFPLNRLAGTDSQRFHWKWAIGPLDSRLPQQLWPWAAPAPIRFGPVEWIRWVQERDSEARFVWVVNLREEAPEDHADLAQFLVGQKSKWAEYREELGIPQPVPVAIWEIGNETDWDKDKPWDVGTYIDAARKAIAAIRSVDPQAKVAVQAMTAPWSQKPGGTPWWTWHQAVLRELGPKVDYVTFHPYYEGLPIRQIDPYIDRLRDDIRQITGSDRVKIYLSEHGRWPSMPASGKWKDNWYQTHSLEGCLATAQFLVDCLNRPEIAAASYHSFSSGPWKMISRDEASQRLYTTGIADLFRLLNHLGGGTVVSTQAGGPGGKKANGFFAAAVQSDDALFVLAVNRGAQRGATFAFDGKYRMANAWDLSGASLGDYDTLLDKPIKLKARPGESETPWTATVIPENSVTLLRLEPL